MHDSRKEQPNDPGLLECMVGILVLCYVLGFCGCKTAAAATGDYHALAAAVIATQTPTANKPAVTPDLPIDVPNDPNVRRQAASESTDSATEAQASVERRQIAEQALAETSQVALLPRSRREDVSDGQACATNAGACDVGNQAGTYQAGPVRRAFRIFRRGR